MSDEAPTGPGATGEAGAQAGPAAPPPADGRAEAEVSAASETPAAESGGAAGVALRLLAVVVTLPWAVVYGVTGTWAVALGARSFANGLDQLDAGYTRMVTPAELMFVGALVLAAFAATLACALLLLFRGRSAAAWLPLFLVAAGLTAGSVWAAVRGGLHPVLWVGLFFGIAYVAAVALVKVVQVTRAGGRGTIATP